MMIDFIKFMAEEHPVWSIVAIYFPCWAIHGLGRIGSTTVKHKTTNKET